MVFPSGCKLRSVPAFLAAALLAFCFVTPSQAFETQAEEAILMDAESGTVLWAKNGFEPMPPASMSKLMTLTLLFEAIKDGQVSLEDEFTVSENAWRTGGPASGSSTMFLEPNSTVKVADLIKGIVIQSGNDACIVVAENLAGSVSAFADRMNERAEELGLEHSHFVNPTGWPDPEQYMSPADLATLSRHIIYDLPDFYSVFKEREFTYNGISQRNRNPLIYRDPTVDGLKTGHTEAAGYGLTASAKRGKERLIMVVNGLPSETARANEGDRLLNWGFREFQPYVVSDGKTPIVRADVWQGTTSSVPLVSKEPVNLLLSPDQSRELTAELVYEEPLAAPLEVGQEVGVMRLSAPGMPARELPLTVGEAVERQGFLGRAFSALGQLIFE